MTINQVVRRKITGVEIGLYNDLQVRQRSVVEITSPQTYDSLGTALPKGLYDPALGPIDSVNGTTCPTCGNVAQNCLGHCGHIELCLPYYHPLLFGQLIKFLRSKCLSCHKLRIGDLICLFYEVQLRFIDIGQANVALEIVERENFIRKNVDGEGKKYLLSKLQEYQTFSNKQKVRLNAHERQIKNEVIRRCLYECNPIPKCAECSAISPKIKQESNVKIFFTKLGPRSHAHNISNCVVFKAASAEEWATPTNSADEDVENEPGLENEDGFDSEYDGPIGHDEPANKFVQPLEVEAQVKRTWQKHPYLCASIFGSALTNSYQDLNEGYTMFFQRAVCVLPSKFRPSNKEGNTLIEHAHNISLSKIISMNHSIRTNLADITSLRIFNEDMSEEEYQRQRSELQSKALTSWIAVQTLLNVYMDSSKDPKKYKDTPPGVRQVLEKKEGIFRKNMMGKRVNFACRSVISPDPYIGTNEIAIPFRFANTLTFPVNVCSHNVAQLRELVKNGATKYPGANYVEEVESGKRFDLTRMTEAAREIVSKRLLSSESTVIVGRHLRNGDMMLVNRQPTLHKPGIMGHKVRILHDPSHQTIRMHYANCNTYNADFDGDEMNCHFPQSFVADTEARFIAFCDEQYIVPTDGSPLRGLIQDHVDAGVKLCKIDTFLTKDKYQQLVFAALCGIKGVDLITEGKDIMILPPTIIKPMELWTGKQVISTVLLHLPDELDEERKQGISFQRKTKTPPTAFGASFNEHKILVKDGELLRGVLDKAAFGASSFSLVHAVHELYGSTKAGLLLNSFSRLFTCYLQFYSGHSCRLEDLILRKDADLQRMKKVNDANIIGTRVMKAWADSDGGKVPIPPVSEIVDVEKELTKSEFEAVCSKVGNLLSGKDGMYNAMALDGFMQSQLNPLASEIIKTCLPNGLNVPFPKNTFSLMVNTGAKGSKVNQSQVSCALGQQSLEGRRVPRMSSGRTLPSFAPYDPNPRADGFITDRFLTGIKPQEYYFHCMAGREGLVDTAVKTSRSGYLQRCLIKHLEDLTVGYDFTVRDSENCIVQFLYGEDGIDATKASYLDCSVKSLTFFAENYDAICKRHKALPESTLHVAAQDVKKVLNNKNFSHQNVKGLLNVDSIVQCRKLSSGNEWKRGALCHGWFDAKIIKSYDDGYHFDIKYVADNSEAYNVPVAIKVPVECSSFFPNGSDMILIIRPISPDPVVSDMRRKKYRLGSNGACISEKIASEASKLVSSEETLNKSMKAYNVSHEDISSFIAARYSSSLCAPGEAVGCIAGQSIGEPSTQMTLNTFHLAGSGANLTLGIPRLREVIMTASKSPKTPTMSVPFKEHVEKKDMERLSRKMSKLTLMELIANKNGIEVKEVVERGEIGNWERSYYITLTLYPAERIKESFGLTLMQIARVVASKFVPLLSRVMRDQIRRIGGNNSDIVAGVTSGSARADKSTKSKRNDIEDDEDIEEEDEGAEEEDGVTGSRFGHRKEMTSYGEMDEEDEDIAKHEDKNDFLSEIGEHGVENIEDDGDKKVEEEEETVHFASMKINKTTNSLILQPFRIDPSNQLLMVTVVEKAALKTILQIKKGIEKAFVNDEDGRGSCLQTSGINFNEIWKLETDFVNHNELMSNDTWAVCTTYGVEAARQNIVLQIRAVFGVYGIEIDTRHLSLIADYMTFNGGYRAMNRNGMTEKDSPFLKMSYESTVNYLINGAVHNLKDDVRSPSACIVTGNPIRSGTGAFDCVMKVK